MRHEAFALKKIISGGQTGADLTGLQEARKRGLETGGWATKGYRTEIGPQPELLKSFGLVEAGSPDYDVRTALNVRDAVVTVWFGKENSPGYFCTQKACGTYRKSFFRNPEPKIFRALCETADVINIAGNRASVNPDVVRQVQEAFAILDTEKVAATPPTKTDEAEAVQAAKESVVQ